MDKTLYIVGYYISGDAPNTSWGIHGVFSTEERAISECTTGKCFYMPCILNEAFPGGAEETFEAKVVYPFSQE